MCICDVTLNSFRNFKQEFSSVKFNLYFYDRVQF